MNIADIVTEYGAVYQQRGQNATNLRAQVFAKVQTEQLFRKMLITNTIYEGALTTMTPVLQAFQKSYTPLGGIAFEPAPINLTHLKVDVSEYPDDLQGTWLGFMEDGSLDRAAWPFVKWLMEQQVVPKMREDWETNGIFNGVKGTTTSGTANGIATAINGLKKIQNDAITAGIITPLTLGTVPTDPVSFVEYMEAFCAQIPEKIWPFLDTFAMSSALATRFKQGMREKYNQHYAQTDILKVANYDIPVAGFQSHAGSNRIWITVKDNGVLLVKNDQNDGIFKVEEAKREVSIMTDFWKAVDWLDKRYVFVNDVELPS